ncbi:hypothetical protein [Dactylosporangium sp. NPDC048998]|uniref:hypothetical protein n=1 Tax=Dactylosporangium sp. NPDC048998 TaxID=3363976 RepID=UPI00371FFFBA
MVNLAVQLTRVVPASGDLGVCGQQFWLGPAYADTTVVHLLKENVGRADSSRSGGHARQAPERLPLYHARMSELLSPADPEFSDNTDVSQAPLTDRRPGPVAFALLAIGFVLALAAQYLPWTWLAPLWTSVPAPVSIDDTGSNGTGPLISSSVRRPDTIEIDLANLNTGHVVAYLTTIVLALVAIAVLLSATGAVRRTAIAAAAGLLAGNLLVLVGFKSAIANLGNTPFASFTLPENSVSVGIGYPMAYASAVLLAGGVFVAARGPQLRTRRRREELLPEGGEPLELTVTGTGATPGPRSYI